MLNSVCLMGRLTANPELKSTPSGVPFTRFTLAVNRTYVKSGEERQTDFIDVVAWRRTAEFICRYFKKGQLAAIEGSIQTRNYEAKDGTKRKAFEINVNNVHFAESKKSAEESSSYYDGSPAEANKNTSDEINLANENQSEKINDAAADFGNVESDGFIDDDLLSESDLPF